MQVDSREAFSSHDSLWATWNYYKLSDLFQAATELLCVFAEWICLSRLSFPIELCLSAWVLSVNDVGLRLVFSRKMWKSKPMYFPAQLWQPREHLTACFSVTDQPECRSIKSFIFRWAILGSNKRKKEGSNQAMGTPKETCSFLEMHQQPHTPWSVVFREEGASLGFWAACFSG